MRNFLGTLAITTILLTIWFAIWKFSGFELAVLIALATIYAEIINSKLN